MNDAMEEIEIPKRAPKIVKATPRVPKICEVAQMFAPIPPRALQDERITNSHLRMLGAIGVHASYWGVFYPRLERLAAVANRGRTWAFEKVRDLEHWGYVRRLGPKRHRHAVRRQVIWVKGWPKPPRETYEAPIDRTLRTTPWIFSNFNQPRGDDE